jgi:hypothetical protein
VRARDLPTLTHPRMKTKLVQVCEVQAGSVSASIYDGMGDGAW